MGLDKKFMAQSYKRMSDDELLSIVSNEINDLTPEAREALAEELTARGTGEGIEEAISIQMNGLNDEEREKYIQLIRQMKCPVCSGQDKPLNAILVFNNHYEDFHIACPACLDNIMNDPGASSAGAAAFGSIGGVIKAIKIAAYYEKLQKQIAGNLPSDALLLFIKKRAGEMGMYKNNSERLAQLIKHPNARSF